MPTILLAWEAGSGGGHIVPLLQIAEALKARGARVELAAQRFSWSASAWNELDASYQAPVPDSLFVQPLLGKRADMQPGRSFSDTLRLLSFDRPQALSGQLLAWRALIDAAAPDLILADFSPGATLAARGRVPVIACGAPFCTPPSAGSDLFNLSDDEPQDAGRDAQLLAVVNEVLADLGETPLAGLADGFIAPVRLPFGLVELDPYASVRPEPLLPPVIDGCTSMAGGGDEVLVYLPGHYKNDPVVAAALLGLGLPVRIDERELLIATRDHFLQRGMGVEKSDMNAEFMAQKGAVIFSHGGSGTVMRALMAGVPQVALIGDREKRVYGEAIERLGVGVTVKASDKTVPKLREAINKVYDDPSYANRAQALAPKFRRRRGIGATPHQIAERALAMI